MEKRLKKLVGKRIVVVMDDGLALLGSLKSLDKDTLILKDVYQAPSEEIEWEDPGEKKKMGYVDWTHVDLDEVYIRVEHVLRVWPWKSQKAAEKRALIYSRDEAFLSM